MAKGGFRAWLAERRRTGVSLNLPELARLYDAAMDAGAGSRGADHDLDQAARRIQRARDRRLRAVERARTA
jgi:hypothetical protein